ncbi:MAG: hypothetical protein ACOCRX_00645 [Candidatus Woesearchaeota archaeon]
MGACVKLIRNDGEVFYGLLDDITNEESTWIAILLMATDKNGIAKAIPSKNIKEMVEQSIAITNSGVEKEGIFDEETFLSTFELFMLEDEELEIVSEAS